MLSKIKKLLKLKKKTSVKKKKIAKKKLVKKPKRKVLKTKKALRVIKKQPTRKEELVGIVTHYFPHVKAGVIKIKKGPVSIGDTLHIKGHTTDFTQKVTSIQIERRPIKAASKGEEIGLLVKSRVRHNDKAYKVK